MVDLFSMFNNILAEFENIQRFTQGLEEYLETHRIMIAKKLSYQNEELDEFFKKYLESINREERTLIEFLSTEIFRNRQKEILYLSQASALAKKIVELGCISSSDFIFLIEHFRNVVVKLKSGNNTILVIRDKQSKMISVVLNVFPGNIRLLEKRGKNLIINPVLQLLFDATAVDFIKYYINMRDTFSANNIFDANGNIIDTVGFGIVDAYESYREEEKKIEGQNNGAR